MRLAAPALPIFGNKILMKKSAEILQRPPVLRSALSNQEKTVDNSPFHKAF
ncbi:MAG: hypothetical protein ACTTJV_01220 [Ottowia sp.]